MCWETSAAVSMRRRNCSKPSASSTPPNSPSSPATPNRSGGRGWTGESSGEAGSTSVAIISLLSAIESWNACAVAAAAAADSSGSVVRAVIRRMPLPPSVEVSMWAVSGLPRIFWARARLTRDFAVSA